MTEALHETHQPADQPPVEAITESPQYPGGLFAVRDEDIVAIVPSVTRGAEAFMSVLEALNPKPAEENEDETPLVSPASNASNNTTYNRAVTRRSKNVYGPFMVDIIQTGAQYLATFEDPDEAFEAGRQIFYPEVDSVLGDMYPARIVPAAAPLRHLNQAASVTGAEITALAKSQDNEHLAQRYMLLKALGQGGEKGRIDEKGKLSKKDEEESPDLNEPNINFAVSALHAMSESDAHRRLSNELQSGAYDHLIAHDILWHLDATETTDNELIKIRQLVTFMRSFTGSGDEDKETFYNRMVAVLPDWPISQQQVIREARLQLQSRLDNKLTLIVRALKEGNFISSGDPKQAFSSAFSRLGDEMLKRTPIVPQNKVVMMGLRAQVKRGRITPKRQKKTKDTGPEEEVTQEGPREPLKLVTCNLNDHTVEEGTDAMVDEFVEQVRQGDVTLRADLERMLNFMARTDLPPTHRRGVKAIGGSKVKFSTAEEPDKLWDFFEFKPTEAAGLPTRTSIAKNSRIYFIKMGDDTLGIIGIKSRADQDAFLRAIRNKIKRRGDQ